MKKRLKKGLSLLLALCVVLALLPATASAASQVYYNIDLSSAVVNSRITQKNSSDCALCSIATIEAYLYGATSSTDKTTVYNKMVNTNLGSTSGKPNAAAVQSWANLGYVKTTYSLQALYNQLAQGYPVLIHRTNGSSQHWSVVCGYTGSTSTLQESGFKVVDVSTVYSSTNCTKTLTAWKNTVSGAKLDAIAYRKNGIAVSLPNICMAINYPETVHITGDGHGVYGYVTSNVNLTNVTVKVVEALTGKSLFTKSVNPNAKTYSLYSLDSSMTFAKWPAGQYLYIVTATDSAGKTKHFCRYFSIASSWPSSMPKATATVTYDSNGGSGSMDKTGLVLNTKFTMSTCTFTRSGYEFVGWTAKRNTDNKWYCGGSYGWLTEDEIAAQGCSKRIYPDGWSGTYDYSWLKNGDVVSHYTLYAQWSEVGHTHSYVDEITPPTCTEQGYTTHTCQTCGVSYEDSYVEATGHSWDEGVVTIQPTEDTEGEKTYTCKLCGGTWTEYIPAIGTELQRFTDDTNEGTWSWASKYIYACYDAGIISGISNGDGTYRFEPDSSLTRAQAAVLFAQALGLEEKTDRAHTFTDDNSAGTWSWAAKHIYACRENGIINGYEDGSFQPDKTITRAEFAVMMAGALNLSKDVETTPFPDDNNAGTWKWAGPSIYACKAVGIVSGDGQTGKFNPNDTITRAQAAVMMASGFDLV